MKTFKVCTGIGDNIWLFQKLLNTEEKFKFLIPKNEPQRGKQVFDLLPQVGTAEYANVSNNDAIEKTVSVNTNFAAIPPDRDYFLSFNKQLEDGLRIENIFPDLPTSYRIEFETAQHSLTASKLLFGNYDYFGIYTSKHGNTINWKGWGLRDWLYYCTAMHKANENFNFVIVGAEYDGDLSKDLARNLSNRNIPYTLLIGENLGLVIEIMKRLKFFTGFPSGLSVLANMVGCPSLMFYPKHLELMINAWAEPYDIKNGFYKGMLFPHVGKAIEHTLNYLEI
jgi:ADP-heptose:LPS heptosyltransferase